MDPLSSVFQYIDMHGADFLDQLRQFLRQPSVSPQSIGVEDCARLLATYMSDLGCTADVVPTKGNPVVYGKLHRGAAKTLLIYMMYDTQPYDEPGWTHPPMEAQFVEMDLGAGRVQTIVNRGAVNSKGPLMACLHAMQACLAERALNLNLLLVAEGEEELGSPHLPDFVQAYKSELKAADACFFPFFLQDQYGVPRLYLGNKGIIYFELECSGKRWGRGPQEFDIHSSQKAWVDSPAWRMIQALATFTDKTGNRVAIKGFYDNAELPSSSERTLIDKLARRFSPRSIKESSKIKHFTVDERKRKKLLQTYLSSPTINVDGIWGGYTGPGSKTVLPHKVTVKMDVRLVPNQKPDKILKLVRKHLKSRGYGDIHMRLLDYYNWAQTDPEADVVQAVVRTCKGFGHEPEVWPRIGGSAPFYLFSEWLKIPFSMGVLGHGARAHSPDEYIVWKGNPAVAGYTDAVKSIARFFDLYAAAR